MSIKESIRPYDKFVYGIIPGLILPTVLFVYYVNKYCPYADSTLDAIIRLHKDGIISNQLIMSAIPNMLLVFVLYKIEAFKLASAFILGIMPFLISCIFMM